MLQGQESRQRRRIRVIMGSERLIVVVKEISDNVDKMIEKVIIKRK